ncbi:MAG: ATP-binding protein [Promethearchaeota archaeon]
MKNGKCSSCENDSIIIHRKISKQDLCTSCFENSIEENIYKTISKYKMLQPDKKIIVALSGGKDSITLLYNLIKIQENTYNSNPVIALTIDEGIKDYRDQSVEYAKKFCRRYNIEHKILRFQEAVGYSLDQIINIKKDSPDYRYACNYCATFRRRLLNDEAKKLGGDIIALGHNLTDIAETFMMNILYKRLPLIGKQYIFKKQSENISKFFLKKITPLMRIPEEEIFLYANLKKLFYYPSHCPYREKDPIIRKRVLDFIQKCKAYSPEIEFNLLNGFLELSKILYHSYKEVKYNYCQVCGYPSGNSNMCTYCNYLKELND